MGQKAATLNAFDSYDIKVKIKIISITQFLVTCSVPERQKLDHLLQGTVCAAARLANRGGNRGNIEKTKLQLIVIDFKYIGHSSLFQFS